MDKFEQWAERKFEGLSRAELREAGEKLGCTFGPNTAEATMRHKLCEVVGASSTQPDSAEKQKPAPKTMRTSGRPGLGPLDKWEGRRHRCIVHKGPDDADKNAFTLWWNGSCLAFEFGKEVDIPEPYFNSMKQCVVKQLLQRPVRNENGQLERIESYEIGSPRFAYNYIGITPGTEHLPGSILEYWQRRAKENDYFRGLSSKPAGRKALIQILSDITEPRTPDYYKDLTNEDILVEILRFLGFEDVLYEDIDAALVA